MKVCPCTALFLKKGSMARRERDWRPGTFELPTLCLEGLALSNSATGARLNLILRHLLLGRTLF